MVEPPIWQTDPDIVPWATHAVPTIGGYCNLCRWRGAEFASAAHTEGNHCPGCGSTARERFLHRAWIERWKPMEWAEVIETSPRLGHGYRDFMSRRLRYRGSDYDLRAHQADVRIDLTDIDLPDNSLDVLLTSHVLEHIPEPEHALREVRRVLAPGGLMVLQVPMVEPRTTVPAEPEYHADDTLVHWRFGWDLTEMIADAGFDVRINVTESMATALATGRWGGPPTPEFDLPAVIRSGGGRSVDVIVPVHEEPRLGFDTGYGLVTWTAHVPGDATPRCAPSSEELERRRDRRRTQDAVRHPFGHPLDPQEGIPRLSWRSATFPLYVKVTQSLQPVRPVLGRLRRAARRLLRAAR